MAKRGPMGGHGHGPGAVPGEKAKDFKGTMKKLMGYLGRYKIGIFFVVIFAFPIIAGLIDNKISSIVISSLGIAFLIPLLINIFKATEPFTTFEYNGVTIASCVLNPSLFVDIIGLILIMLSFVVMLISSLFIKDKAK